MVPEKTRRRTLYPGGYKRAEIKVPNVVLTLDADEVDTWTLDIIDVAVAKWVGIVVLNGGEGGKLYEAASLLKSIIRDRAFLLVAERVDIAAAVNATGVLLSDHGFLFPSLSHYLFILTYHSILFKYIHTITGTTTFFLYSWCIISCDIL